MFKRECNRKIYIVSVCNCVCMEGRKTYRLETNDKVWEEFRKTLMKDDVINDILTNMIKERIKKFKEK